MKKIFLFLSLIINGLIIAQNVECSVGYIYNTFYDLEEENPHYRSEYSGGNGAAVKLSIEKFKLADSIVPVRLEISYTNYKGHAEIMNSALGGGSTEYADINKSVLGLSIYPLLFRIKKSIRIDLGLEMDILLLDKSKGYYQSWSMSIPQQTGEISDFDNASTNFGVIFQTGYEFMVKNNWFLYPRYHLYIGITKDYSDAKSVRNQFEVGLSKRIK
jgi:hypothetical protein